MKVIPKFIKDWLQETINRLFIKKPRYFQYWQWISYVGMAISGIPYLLIQIQGMFPNFQLGEPFATLSNKVIAWVAVAMFWMSQFTVVTPTVGQTVEGSAIKVTDEQKMPFTSSIEKGIVADTKPPEEVMPEVPETVPETDDK